jgi:hypothetical protein
MPNNNPNIDPEAPDISEVNLRRLESEIAKNKADQQKSEIEAEEIRKRLNQKWYASRIFVQTGIGAIVSAALITAWFVGFFEPMLSHKQRIASLKNDMLSLENKREKQLNKAQQEDNERITSSLRIKLASLEEDNKIVSEALTREAEKQKALLETTRSELRELSRKPTTGKERPKYAAREQALEKQIKSIDQKIQEIGDAQQSAKERSHKIIRDSIYTANTSTRVKEDWWNWEVFIVGDDSTLKEIKYVEYTLHPSFRDPIRKVSTQGSTSGKGFFLSASGWGTFMITVKIMFKDGDVRELRHKLSFSQN